MGTRQRRRRTRLAAGLAGLVSLIAACAPAPGIDTIRAVKRSEFGPIADADAAGVAAGTRQPVVEFKVEGTPPSIFINYVIPDAQASAFADFVDLPPGFSLAKLKIVESDPTPQYWLSLNVYRVSGLTTGLRAEWSTYVDDGSGVPRFMIVRARASEGSIDPIGPLAPPEPFTHDLAADVIRTDMNKTVLVGGTTQLTSDPLYDAEIRLPAPPDRDFATPALEWVRANDFIYWLNGVNDRIFHNSSSHDARLLSVDLADVTLSDQTEYVPFVEPQPAHVLVYLDPIEFMIGPWWNITAPDGRVDPVTLAALADFKRNLYSGLMQTVAAGVWLGAAEPVVRTAVDTSSPSAFWHWQVPGDQAAAFAAAAGIPAGLSLAPIRLESSDASPAYWLTLNVRRESGPFAGLRADWTTYVDDGTRVRTFVVEGRADHPWLDPANLPSAAAPRTASVPITHVEAGGVLSTSVGAGGSLFTSTIAVPPGPATVEPTRTWIGAADRRYWRNGVADRVYYSFEVFDPKVVAGSASVSTSGGNPWVAFTTGAPERVWIDRSPVEVVANPWWDLSRV